MSDERLVGGTGETDRSEFDCGRVLDLLPLWTYASLTGAEVGSVERHLEGCDACRGEVEFLEIVRRARPEPPAGFAEGVRRRLAEERARPVPATPGRRIAVGWGFAAAAAAAAVAAVGLGILPLDGVRSEREALLATLVESEDAADAEEWMIAGAPAWEALPDEVLVGLVSEDET